jgi:autotransporter-associated beta strand protein
MKPNLKQLTISKVLGLAGLLAISATTVQAALWQGGTASYNNTANWDNGLIPSAANTGNAINRSGSNNVVQVNPGDPNWTLGNQDVLLGDVGNSSGAYYQDGPTVTLNFWFRMGLGGGTSSGYATVNSGTLNIGGQLNVSEGGPSVFNNTNTGVVTAGGECWIGNGGGSDGTYNLGGSAQMSVNNWVAIGRSGGTGRLNMSGSSTFNKTGGGQFIIGDSSVGTLNQSGTSAITINNELWVAEGGSGNAVYNMSQNAAITVNNWVAIGRDGGTGVVNMTNNASITKSGANVFILGASGPGTLNQDGGTVTVNSLDSWLGENNTAIWNQNAGSNVLAYVQLGRNGGSSGTLNLNGGAFAANQIASGGGSSALNFNGGTLRARTASASFMTGVPGYLQAGGAVIDSAGNNVTISSTLADGASGGLTKTGNGTLTLSGANSYVGTTVVSAGKLIEGTASTVTSDVNVANAAGYGVKPLVLNGQVSHGNVTLSGATGSLDFDLGSFGNPSTAPLNVSTLLSVAGTITVNVTASVLAVGTVPLVQFTAISGTHTFALGTLPAGVVANLVETGSQLQLVITSAGAPRWDGNVAGTWNFSANQDWFDLGTLLPTTYSDGKPVVFNDAAVGTTNVNITAIVKPSSIVVTNDLLTYTFKGTGSIAGSTGLTKQGTNSLTIQTTNSYTGQTVISGGTLSITNLANGGAISAIGASSANATNLVLDGGTLSYSGPAVTTDRGYTLASGSSTLDAQSDMTFNGIVNATVGANFIKTGNGTLSVKRTGTNTLSQGGGGNSYQIRNGTVVLDGSAGAQVNTINGEIWPGATDAGTGGNLVLTNTKLNLSSWLAIARGTGTGGYTSSVTMFNSALQSVNMSLCYDNGIGGTLQTGILTMNGNSTFTNNGDGNLGESTGGTSIINLNGSVFYNNNRAMIGWHNGAQTTVTVANSAKIVVNSWISIGNEGGTGSVTVKDSGALVTTADLNVCDVNTGTGDLTAKDNATVSANNIYVGKGAGSTGTLTITNNATVVSANGITIASAAAAVGTVNLDGGSLAVNLVQSTPGSGTLNFNGGRLIARNPFSTDFVFNMAAINVLAGGAVIDSTNFNIAISEPLLDGGTGGGLTKLGSGKLTLNGVSTYTGATAITQGSLGGTLASAVTIASGATLAPGAGDVGTLTINNNLTIVGNLAVDVNKTNSPTTNDLVVVSGTLLNSGTGTVTVSNTGNNAVQVGDSFTLFSQPVTGGAALTVAPSAGVVWTNKLAIDGSIQAVAIIAPPVVVSGGVSVLPNGNVTLTATGTIGSTYKLWGTTNVALPLASWTLISSGTVTTSPFSVTDTTAAGNAQKFYIFSTP